MPDKIPADWVLAATCRVMGVAIDQVADGKLRHPRLIAARQIFVAAARRLTTVSYPGIAGMLSGSKNHSTIIEQHQRFERRMKRPKGDPDREILHFGEPTDIGGLFNKVLAEAIDPPTPEVIARTPPPAIVAAERRPLNRLDILARAELVPLVLGRKHTVSVPLQKCLLMAVEVSVDGGRDEMSRLSGCCETTIWKVLKVLRDRGYLEELGRRPVRHKVRWERLEAEARATTQEATT